MGISWTTKELKTIAKQIMPQARGMLPFSPRPRGLSDLIFKAQSVLPKTRQKSEVYSYDTAEIKRIIETFARTEKRKAYLSAKSAMLAPKSFKQLPIEFPPIVKPEIPSMRMLAEAHVAEMAKVFKPEALRQYQAEVVMSVSRHCGAQA